MLHYRRDRAGPGPPRVPIAPEPRKRPRSSYTSFAVDLPNERWQADVTHWPLANGRIVEICSIIDDHSRLLVPSGRWSKSGGQNPVSPYSWVVVEAGSLGGLSTAIRPSPIAREVAVSFHGRTISAPVAAFRSLPSAR